MLGRCNRNLRQSQESSGCDQLKPNRHSPTTTPPVPAAPTPSSPPPFTKFLKEDVQPVGTSTTTELYDCKQELEKTATLDDGNCIERLNSRFLQSPHCAANCLQQVRSSGPGAIVSKSRATHRALITCNLQRDTWYEWTAQLLSLTELKSHLFQPYFIG